MKYHWFWYLVSENEASQEGKSDFYGEGGARQYLSLEQAKLLAMETARDAPANYGQSFTALQMVFQTIEQEERDDYYIVTLSFRPEGDFFGTPGRERFYIAKEGTVTDRRVIAFPYDGGKRSFLWRPLTIGATMMVIVAVSWGAWATGICGREINEDQRVPGSRPVASPSDDFSLSGILTGDEPITVPNAAPSTGKLVLFLVPSDTNRWSISTSNKGLRKASLAKVSLVFGLPKSGYNDLRPYLWTKSSLKFSGTGFSGVWGSDDEVLLVLQLNGPMRDANYLRCVAIQVNEEEISSSCGTKFDDYKFVTGGYTVIAKLSAPERLDTTDNLEISIVLGTHLKKGEKVAPFLVYGGEMPEKISFLEIGGSRN